MLSTQTKIFAVLSNCQLFGYLIAACELKFQILFVTVAMYIATAVTWGYQHISPFFSLSLLL
jgi:hypothetical protein